MNIILDTMSSFRKNNRSVLGDYGNHLDPIPGIKFYDKDLYLNQVVGDAIALFRAYYDRISTMITPEGELYLTFSLDEDEKFFLQGPSNIEDYCVTINKDYILVGAYDEDGKFIRCNRNAISSLKLFMPAIVGLLAADDMEDGVVKTALSDFLRKGDKVSFNELYGRFYCKHIAKDYIIKYADNRIAMASLPKKEEPTKFDDSLCELIPQLSRDEFELPKRLSKISRAVQKGDVRTLLFHGPAGTGKTMACKLLAREIQFPLMATINCTENLDEFILGKYIPVGSEIIFQESEVTRAIREGGIVVFEEINFAKPQYLAFLNSLLDDNGFVRLDNGVIVKRHPLFRFFATMNMGYFGTKELNQALYNRFNAIVEIPTLSEEDIKRMLLKRVPSCRAYVKKLLGTYKKIRNLIEKQELDIVISPRNLENWARLAKYEGYLMSAEATIIPIAKEDKDLAEAIRSIVQTYRWDITSDRLDATENVG